MSIPAIGTQNYNPASLFQRRTDWSSGMTDPRLDSPARPASSTKATAANRAVTVELSDQAKAALEASPPSVMALPNRPGDPVSSTRGSSFLAHPGKRSRCASRCAASWQ